MDEKEIMEVADSTEEASEIVAEEKVKKAPIINLADIKDTAGKAVQAIEGAAKDVGEFADEQFKNAKTILVKSARILENH